MIQVYFSHLGEVQVSGIYASVEVHAGRLSDILTEIEEHCPDLSDKILDESKSQVNSATLLFKHIDIDVDGRLLESEQTEQIRYLDDIVYEEDTNLLIALFHPEKLVAFLLQTLTPTDQQFEYAGKGKTYRSYMSAPDTCQGEQVLFAQAEPEPLYPFTYGSPMRELVTDGNIDVAQRKLIPRPIQKAIAKLWEITEDHSLRLFQEEALSHILQELTKESAVDRKPLLLSIPTGGGKTEAFLIPLIAHLHNQRTQLLRAGTVPQSAVRAIIAYPTRALANDQAKRIAEILCLINNEAVADRKISIGVLTGDTPASGQNLLTEKSVLQLCPRCSAVLTAFFEKVVQGSSKKITIVRCICGAEIDYFRLVRQDILEFPPDILITSPDMINYMLQSPRYQGRIFSSAIDIVVFDEVHMYNSVFGCNVAHLLRRFEDVCKHKPLYVGVSATIRNAKELACLIFNADLATVRYLRPKKEEEPESEEKRPYLDYQAKPNRYRYHYALTPSVLSSGQRQKVTTSVLNIADVIGHIIRDPHFRKTLIFSNFRQDTDDVLRFLRDQEDRYYMPYQQTILPRLLAMQEVSANNMRSTAFTKVELDIISAVHRWYQQARKQGMLHRPHLEVGWHRGGLEREERIKAVNRFAATQRLTIQDEENTELPIDVMVATNTLELGLDIGDVTTVINCGAPFTANEYIQRVGRGGRRKDALALTVIDTRNPLDFYFLKHFNEYVHPTPDTFEDAPIIISNEEVMKSHVYARLLDHIASFLCASGNYKEEIQVSDLQDTVVFSQSMPVSFRENWQVFCDALFREIFPSIKVEYLQDWIRREADIIPDISETSITQEEIEAWWQDKCEQVYKRIESEQLRETDVLSGMTSKERELVPDLRSSGPGVGLYLVSEAGEDKPRDTISRRQAITSRPVGGFASQGSVTFKIESLKENDHDTERDIRGLFRRSSDADQVAAYFHTMFGDKESKSPFPADPLDVLVEVKLETPRDLSVKYNPYRFYCPKCGATYSDKKAGDERCTYCYGMLRQLTEVYMCGGCGDIFIPPIPKVCLNVECIAVAQSAKDKTRFMDGGYKRVGKGDRHNEFFRFTALPQLHWQCRACKTEINYHAYYELPQHIRTQLDATSWGQATPAQMAKSFLNKPESCWGKTYQQDGFHPARFTCPKCKSANTYKKITVINIPSFRSVVQEYIHTERSVAPELQDTLGLMHFKRTRIIALAHEQFRRYFCNPERTMKIDLTPIFSDKNRYLANMYKAHAVFFRFSNALDRFVTQEVSAYCQLDQHCMCRNHSSQSTIDDNGETETSEHTGPQPALLEWEKGRKPDPRRKWCDVVQHSGKGENDLCPGPDKLCTTCQYFQPSRYQRYLILHTLAHAIITAMPKYTGINKNQIRETIFPNDKKDYDLVLVDTIEGGSGCMYLLRKNWQQIWQIVGELLEDALQEQGELLLPYTCLRYNKDLCPHLAYEFYKYLSLGKD